MKSPAFRWLTIPLALTFSGCMSLSTYQTADTVEEGKSKWGVGFSQSYIVLNDEEQPYDINSVVTPEFSIRVGMSENTDLGLKLYPVAVIIDVKHRFYQTEQNSSAFGLGFSTIDLDETTSTADNNLTDLYATYYYTHHHSSTLSSTIAPKLIYRTNTETDKNVLLPGLTYTLDYQFENSSLSLRPEIGVYKFEDTYLGHVGLGISF